LHGKASIWQRGQNLKFSLSFVIYYWIAYVLKSLILYSAFVADLYDFAQKYDGKGDTFDFVQNRIRFTLERSLRFCLSNLLLDGPSEMEFAFFFVIRHWPADLL